MKIRGFIFQKKGFTILEFLVSLSILTILAMIIFSSVSTFRSNKGLQIVAEDILSLLNEGRNDTLSAKDSYSYGVHFESSEITIFRGTIYSSSDTNNRSVVIDGSVEIASISLVGGGQNVLFQKLTGKTNQSGTIIIRLKSDNSKTKTITIEASGVASSD